MSEVSSTHEIPQTSEMPRHVAIIMDGNGRWARRRRLPRIAGHRRGAEAVRASIRACGERGIEYLTLFAFSSENWRRPAEEVALLMKLFKNALEREVDELHANGIRLKVVGDTRRFDPKIQSLIERGERLTARQPQAHADDRGQLRRALGHPAGVQRFMRDHPGAGEVDEELLAPYLAMSYAPEPDLFIRTGGEQRISNFLLWQLAYTELYFTETLWPDFDAAALDAAIASYRSRERRFGRTSEQVEETKRPEVA